MIRKQARSTRILTEELHIETWLSQENNEREIDIELGNLANRKSHGTESAPGEAYKATRKLAIRPLTNARSKIKNGQEIPENWKIGTIVYIYKSKGRNE